MRKWLIVMALIALPLRSQSVVQVGGQTCTNCTSVTAVFGSPVTNGHSIIASCGHSGPLNACSILSDSLGDSFAMQDANGLNTCRGTAAGGGRFMFSDIGWNCNSLGGSGVTVTCSAIGNIEGSIDLTIQEVSGLPFPCKALSGTGTQQSGNSGCVGGCSSVLVPGAVIAPSGLFMETVVWEEADGSSAPTCSPFTYRTSVYDGGAVPASTQVANCDKINTDPINAQSNTFTFSSNTGSWNGFTLAFAPVNATPAHARRHAQIY